ncbi:MAG: SDR family oxidoreductase [Candidatus Omnitrophota bacterium]
MRRMNIVVTGASAGIGEALTRALSQEGHRLFVCARRAEKLKQITDDGALAQWRVCDISEETQVADFAEWIATQTDSVDAVVNCAGLFGSIGPMHETDTEEWFQTLKINLLGPYLTNKYFFLALLKSFYPRIVNFSGGGAFNPFPHYSAYAVSKAATVRMTENMAVELAPYGIMVNAVAPGFVWTEIHEATLKAGPEKAGKEHYEATLKKKEAGAVPIEIPVACVRFLLSEQADGLTGKTLSASFDPWSAPEFQERIEEINRSELYTMRRINLAHLPNDPLSAALSAAKKKG